MNAFQLFLIYLEIVSPKDWQFLMEYNAGQDYVSKVPQYHADGKAMLKQ